MSHKSDAARLEFILEMIRDIETISERHGSPQDAMCDREGFHAVMMCFLQIGEVLAKIVTPEYRDRLPVRVAQSLRNLIAHDYLGVAKERMISTIENSIPELKQEVQAILSGMRD